ncbi:MAG TPA: hypothetical protein VK634_15760 [Reyranella sp.]|nr:hypothetical protein [Reyranella sp.]
MSDLRAGRDARRRASTAELHRLQSENSAGVDLNRYAPRPMFGEQMADASSTLKRPAAKMLQHFRVVSREVV